MSTPSRRTRLLFPLAVAVKLADRFANVEACEEGGPHGERLLRKYRGEAEEFRKALYREGEFEALWERLWTAYG